MNTVDLVIHSLLALTAPNTRNLLNVQAGEWEEKEGFMFFPTFHEDVCDKVISGDTKTIWDP